MHCLLYTKAMGSEHRVKSIASYITDIIGYWVTTLQTVIMTETRLTGSKTITDVKSPRNSCTYEHT